MARHVVRDRLITAAQQIRDLPAFEARQIGYLPRALSGTTMPHSARGADAPLYRRRDGRQILELLSGELGLPYGVIPRMLMIYLSTQVVRQQSPTVYLGANLSEFMAMIGIQSCTGGERGSITYVKDQMARLLTSTIRTMSDLHPLELQPGQRNVAKVAKSGMVDHASISWSLVEGMPDFNSGLSHIRVSDDFYQHAIQHSAPIDLRAIKALGHSPMAIDIYCWLTQRLYRQSVSGSARVVRIPWYSVQGQLGSEYEKNAQGGRGFRKHFRKQMEKIRLLYPGAKVTLGAKALFLSPSPPHVRESEKLNLFL